MHTSSRLLQTQIQKPLNIVSLPLSYDKFHVDGCIGDGLSGRIAEAGPIITLDQQSRNCRRAESRSFTAVADFLPVTG
jgi:hypothetical protein